jgi:hypothetical protein
MFDKVGHEVKDDGTLVEAAEERVNPVAPAVGGGRFSLKGRRRPELATVLRERNLGAMELPFLSVRLRESCEEVLCA